MFTLLDEQKARRFWEEELRQEDRAEGQAKGENLMAVLITKLSTLGHTEVLLRATANPKYRHELYHEFKLA